MPLMPMPPMPTKCTGPMSRGSFIAGPWLPPVMAGLLAGMHVLDALNARRGWPGQARPCRMIDGNSATSRNPPAGRRRQARRPTSPPSPCRQDAPDRPASAAISAASRSGVKSACGRRIAPPAFSSTAALAFWSWSSACGSGTRIDGPADGGEFRDGGRAGARDHEMACRHPRRQIGEERRDVGLRRRRAHRCRARAADPPRAPAARPSAASADAARAARPRGGTISAITRAPWLPPNTSRRKAPSGAGVS